MAIFVDIIVSIYAPRLAKALLESTLETTIIWGVVWYGILKFLDATTRYIIDLASYPFVNDLIQKTKFSLCQKWHAQNSSIKEGEFLSYVKRIGFGIRMFYRHGVLTFIPALYKLIITGVVFYQIQFLSKWVSFCIGFFLILPFFWISTYLKTRVFSWGITDKTGRVIQEFIRQKNWNVLYKEKLDAYLSKQLNIENKEWCKSNVSKNIFLIKKEICIAVLTILIFGSALLKVEFEKSNFLLIQMHFISVLVSFNIFFTELLFIGESLVDLQKIYEFLKAPIEKAIIHTSNNITIKNLTFRYFKQDPLFQDFNLDIQAGEKILIKGENGAGKSTLIRLLSGELKPQKGIVFRPKSFVVIEQEPTLFTETLRFHLTFGLTRQPSESELQKVSKQVYLNLPLDKVLSNEVSMGEKIKALIVRALLEKPDVLILDESLRSLPKEEQKKILNIIFKNIQTVVVIAHYMDEDLFNKIIDLNIA